MAVEAKALALIPKRKQNSTSGVFIAPLKNTLSDSQRKTAVRILSTTLPFGWVTHSGLKPRKYGKHYGLPNYCSKCGKTVKQLVIAQGINPALVKNRRRYLAVHLAVEH